MHLYTPDCSPCRLPSRNHRLRLTMQIFHEVQHPQPGQKKVWWAKCHAQLAGWSCFCLPSLSCFSATCQIPSWLRSQERGQVFVMRACPLCDHLLSSTREPKASSSIVTSVNQVIKIADHSLKMSSLLTIITITTNSTVISLRPRPTQAWVASPPPL